MIHIGEDGAIRFLGIQPDIIGEAYVLMIFRSYTKEKRLMLLAELLEKRKEQTTRFLYRLMNDYLEVIKRMDLLSHLPIDLSNIFYAVDTNGLTVMCEILFVYESDETGKHYTVYTDNSMDEDGSIRVYASIFNPDSSSSELEPIETDFEWAQIEKILSVIRETVDSETSSVTDNEVLLKKILEKLDDMQL